MDVGTCVRVLQLRFVHKTTDPDVAGRSARQVDSNTIDLAPGAVDREFDITPVRYGSHQGQERVKVAGRT
ncbi:hypothetical protein CURTO8I2_210014 [Curtobacterium sp. 8I-2]|nr:hypothetical protein CURTO8I2_210014 [Curtobacterium sp. 8I-2]